MKRTLPPLYFNSVSYLAYCQGKNASGQTSIMATPPKEFEIFLLKDRHWRARCGIYDEIGNREYLRGDESYEAFRNEIMIVFDSAYKKKAFLEIIFKSSPHLPLYDPFFSKIKFFVSVDWVEVFQLYKDYGYNLSHLLNLFSKPTAKVIEAAARKISIYNAVKTAEFYVSEGLISPYEMYRACIIYQSIPLLLMIAKRYFTSGASLPVNEEPKDDKGQHLPVLLHIVLHLVPGTGPDRDPGRGMGEEDKDPNYLKLFKTLATIHGEINYRDTTGNIVESVVYRAVLARNEDIVNFLLDSGVQLGRENLIVEQAVMLRLNPSLIFKLLQKGAPITEEAKYVLAYLGDASYRNEVNQITRNVLYSADYMHRAESERASGIRRFYRDHPDFDPDRSYNPNIVRYRGKKPK